MKVLQINCVYGEGSTGKITKAIHEGLLAAGEESLVLCGRRAKQNEGVYGVVPEWYAKLNNLRARITGVVYGGCYLSTAKIKRFIKKEKPDIVHLQCINGFFCNIFSLLKFLKESKIPTVLTLHAEFMYTANCSHAGECDQWKTGCKKCSVRKTALHSLFFDRTSYTWRKMHNIYKNWKDLYVVGCSKWIVSRASQSGELADNIFGVLYNGIDNEKFFYPRSNVRDLVAAKYDLPEDKKYILFVSPGFSTLKGFDLFLELVKKSVNESVHFILVGGEYDSQYNNLTVVGKVSNGNELADLYSAADALVVCSRNDTYPTVCLEATSCGTPVVGFDVGGVSETICDGMGGVVPFGDVEAMLVRINEVIQEKPSIERVENARYAHSEKRMVNEYISLYKSLL